MCEMIQFLNDYDGTEKESELCTSGVKLFGERETLPD